MFGGFFRFDLPVAKCAENYSLLKSPRILGFVLNIVGPLHISSYVFALCCIEIVKSVVPPGSRGRHACKTTKRLVDDNHEKTIYSVQAVPDMPSSCCASRSPPTEHSARQSKNASSRRSPRHGSSLINFSSLVTSRQSHGVRSATAEARMSDKLHPATSNDTTLRERALCGTVNIQTTSERQSRCNGRIVTSATQYQTDNKPPANVKMKKKKRNRHKSDGWL